MAIERLSITAYNSSVMEVASTDPDMRLGWDLNPPYQRGSVWSPDQQRRLIYSLIRGIPVGAITINRRPVDHLRPEQWIAVVDGKQRVTAIRSFVDGELPVPASWFAEDERGAYIAQLGGAIFFDGEYVSSVFFSGLTRLGRSLFAQATLAICEASVATVEEEAQLHELINFAGQPQTQEDRDRAAAVAAGK